MPNSQPDAATILKAAGDYLEAELLPTLQGYHRFHCRVAVNALAMVRRELEQRPQAERAEATRLEQLLGKPGDLAALNEQLAAAIRSGAIDSADEKLRAHIRQSLVEALSINNPKWLTR